MAIKDFYPAIRPTLDLNFAGSRTVDPRINFTRASTATYFDEFGVMRTAPANAPRIDFDPVTGECKGLLIEERRTNLLTYSEQFDNAAWLKNKATITANATDAPDGTLTADKFETTGGGASYLYQGKTLTQGQAYVLSAYVKHISGVGEFWLRDFTEDGIASFNIINGTPLSSTGIASSPQIVNFGNGWYRVSAVFTPTITTANHNLSCPHPSSAVAGNAFYIWGAQLEQGSFPTSYTPTTSAQVTRAADAASITGTNFSKWYKQEEGTLLIDYRRNSNKASGNQIPFIVSDGTANNIIAITDSANGSSDRVLVVAGGVSQTSLGSVGYTENQRMVRSIGYKKDDVATSVNGSSAASDDLVLIPSVNRLDIGYASYFSTSRINGYISCLSYYPKRLSNTNLQALTA